MVRILVLVVVVFVVTAATPGIARAQRWTDATGSCIGATAEWSNKVELADVDKDGLVDLLIANGGNYASPGTPEPVRIWKNLGGWGTAGTHCQEISAQAVLGFTGLSRVIKAIDVDHDGDLDLITGGAYQTQLKLYLRGPAGWTDASAQLPQQLTSIGDLEAGDVDGDGDLDLLLSDWGAANPTMNGPGGPTRLYLNNGSGTFTDATATHMPAQLVNWSWDVELVDVDNDWDLDALIACKFCSTSYLFRNDGTGHFTDDPAALPHFPNNYDFEPMDIDGDGDLDLATINDGAQLREHIFVNDGHGVFTDESATRLTGTANPANADDNVAVWLDVDADGDADLLIGSLGADRLLINTSGVFALAPNATPNDTLATLGLAAADLDGDGRLDLLQGQGESAFPDKVQLGSTTVAIDIVPPSITIEKAFGRLTGVVRARVHDHQSPSHAHDFQRVWIEHDGPAPLVFESAPPPDTMTDMQWYGEYLWASPVLPSFTHYRVCATDRRGNSICSAEFNVFSNPDGGNVTEYGDTIDAGTGTTGKGAGCCEAGGSPSGAVPLAMIVASALGVRRRRRTR
ncbi:MAG: VCBS repeat-containing protein [Myxococcales bacterium]|nr:VCBS repeat-containing protein [Myxococcales bacterium]